MFAQAHVSTHYLEAAPFSPYSITGRDTAYQRDETTCLSDILIMRG